MTAAALSGALATYTAGGFTLVPLEGKRPSAGTGWNTDPAKWITTPSAAQEYAQRHPGGGVGVLHSMTGTAALDLDHDGARAALAAVGIDLEALLAGNPYRVQGAPGREAKPIWRIPDGLALGRHALSWPDPSGKKGPGGRAAPVTIFELRAGDVQDALPPSPHPSGTRYEWAGPVPQSVHDLPELPPELLSLWQRWGVLEPVMKAACPWAPADVPAPGIARVVTPSGGPGGESVVSAFNDSRHPGEVLSSYGYKGPPSGPWLAPGSSSGQAGVRLLPQPTFGGHAAVYSHHASDPLGDGKPRDAFGVWALLEHGLDLSTAPAERVREVVKDAARLLGLPPPERAGKSAQVTPAESLPAQEWGEVQPLPAAHEPVPSLPPELLPPELALWLEAEARAAGVPLEAVAGPVLTGAANMLPAGLKLRNAPNAPAVPGNLWGALCMPPGSRKSHSTALGVRALEVLEAQAAERWKEERPRLEGLRDIAAAQLEALLTQLKQATKGGTNKKDAPAMPDPEELAAARRELSECEEALREPRHLLNDPTAESLGEVARANPHGVMGYRDELTGWLAGFERAGREQERAFYLEAANGTRPFTFDRLGRGKVHIPVLCVGILGGIQPGPLLGMLEGQRGAGDGLLQRFQVFLWPDSLPDFDQRAQREPIAPSLQEGAAALLAALPMLSPEALGLEPGGVLAYTPEAQAVFDEWERLNAAASRDTGKGEAYRAHIAKHPGTFARLALLFHCLEVAGNPRHPHPAAVGDQAALLAWGWCDYLAHHARKLWGEGTRRDVQAARRVLGYVERGTVRDGQKVTEARAALAQGKAGMTGEELRAALAVLEACGAAQVVTLPPSGGKGGRPSEVLRLHPDALAALEGVRG